MRFPSQGQVHGASLIALTTDFGWADSYVGVVKGVMATVAANYRYGPLQFVDVTHGIVPQDVAAGRFHLGQAVPYFPDGTVHFAVVDPGVGGARRAVAIKFERGFLVGPDNGLFSAVLEQFSVQAAVELNRPEFWRVSEPSRTFHGRDIFATVAAHLACGVSLTDVGTEIELEGLMRIALARSESIPGGWRGCVQHVDHFGNVVTTISADKLEGLRWLAEVAGRQVRAVEAYGEAQVGELVALVGSHGWIEVAVNGGSAANCLGVMLGDEVRVCRL